MQLREELLTTAAETSQVPNDGDLSSIGDVEHPTAVVPTASTPTNEGELPIDLQGSATHLPQSTAPENACGTALPEAIKPLSELSQPLGPVLGERYLVVQQGIRTGLRVRGEGVPDRAGKRNPAIHPMNQYATQEPNFALLASKDSKLRPYVKIGANKRGCIDFKDSDACRYVLRT